MRKIQIVVLVAVAMMFTLSLSATPLAKGSAGYYWDSGVNGTLFSNLCAGAYCPSSSVVGTISGAELFNIAFDVEYDGTDTTYSYVLTDDSGTPVSLTGLLIGTPGLFGTQGSPTSWNPVSISNAWAWLCIPGASSGTCPTAANPGGAGVTGFSETFTGLVAPTLQNVAVTTGTGDGVQLVVPNPDNWVTPGADTPTPEPASLVLLASGLLSGAFFVRRRK